jgi:hypothetical protein
LGPAPWLADETAVAAVPGEAELGGMRLETGAPRRVATLLTLDAKPKRQTLRRRINQWLGSAAILPQ